MEDGSQKKLLIHSVESCWLLVTGYWSLVTDNWLLVIVWHWYISST